MVELLPPPQVLASPVIRDQEKLFKAEQAERDRKKRDEAAAKEFAEQAEFFKNTELLSAKDREGLRNKQQLAFMYQKPPGSNAMLSSDRSRKPRKPPSAPPRRSA